jgi:hypothetical protein
MKILNDENFIKDIWYSLMDYVEMRRSFASGMEAMEEEHHSLTIEELFVLIDELERNYSFLNQEYEGH